MYELMSINFDGFTFKTVFNIMDLFKIQIQFKILVKIHIFYL